MKVSLEQNYRRIYTLEEYDAAQHVIKYWKDDETTAKTWAVDAMNQFCAAMNEADRNEWPEEVLKAEAHTAKKAGAWYLYGDESLNFDVWLDIIFTTSCGVIMMGCYLSDVWGASDEESRRTLVRNAYIRRFEEV